ncbi:MAG: InlB B-repeat-containing protein [Holosporales bacterium]|jgi:uncharacterized repeat protein (TIGR02543 family)|nr:InlB B-repeat-containing protein [Holosporales bacterium]
MRRYLLLGLAAILLIGCEISNPPEPTYYSIAYFGNGNDVGTAPIDSNKYTQGSSAAVVYKGTLSKTGYVFSSWNTSPQGTGISYNPKDIIIINDDISLYAIWNLVVTYTVTFNTNGGGEIQPIAGLQSGSKITEPDDPVKEGFTFDGWHKNADLTELWDFENDVVTDSIKLYAKWTQNKIIYPHEIINISHIKLGNAVIVSWTNPNDENFSHVRIIPAEFEWAESDMLDKEPGISSYSMLDYLGVEYITIKSIDKNGNISNGVKYYFDPKNNPDALTVTFERNGGSSVQSITGLLAGSKVSKPDDPEKSGYSFDGWHKNPELTETWDFDNDVIAGDTSLYAKWLNVAPGEVEITDCVLSSSREIRINYKLPSDADLDYLVVYVNGKLYYNATQGLYYDHYSKNVPFVILQYTMNGSLVTIKTVDTSGLVSNGIDYTINIPGVIIARSDWLEILPSVDVIRKYPDRIDPPSISFTAKALTIDGYVILENPPLNWAFMYQVSQYTVYEYTGPVVIDSSWTQIEFLVADGLGIIASKVIPILSDY